MHRTYRLEFNEAQQQFHLDNGTHDPDTHGWVTIFDHCNDLEFYIFESYVNRIKLKKLTVDYVLKCKIEVEGFMNNHIEYGVNITRPDLGD